MEIQQSGWTPTNNWVSSMSAVARTGQKNHFRTIQDLCRNSLNKSQAGTEQKAFRAGNQIMETKSLLSRFHYD